MFSSNEMFQFFDVFQICVGFMGNSFLFLSYMCMFITQYHMKNARDLIFIHLTLVNVLTILFNLIPHLMSSFGERHFLNDLGCKATLYAFRVTRGLSICTTAFLNAFQAITISPRNSTWAWFKSKISICIYPSFFSFWLINMLIYIHVIETVVARRNVTYVGVWHSYIRCQSKPADKHLSKTFICVMVIRDLFFVVLIVCSSVYMVNLLYKHRRRVQHIHSLSLSSQSSPEIKATHTILLLVSCFVFFYFLENVITLYLLYNPKRNPTLERIIWIISSCYPTICPFVLMKNNKIISKIISPISKMRITFSQKAFRR
ncbi:vomeronasal type-1 receptor 4-like [Camelus bactrianus]|uniref:Vomeronasal type-1 receptor 4-like n=1 Tax=Camelus bactrianus TaxID=9837 RepID=A0AC58QYF4_CAMBA